MPRLVQILNAEVERARRRRGRPAVALDQQRRPLAGGAGIVGIVRRIEQAEGGLARRWSGIPRSRPWSGSRRCADRRDRECRSPSSARVCRPEPRSSATMLAGWSGAPARNTTRSPSARTEPNSVNGVSSGRSAPRRRDPARPGGRAPPAYRRRRSGRARRRHRSTCRTSIAARRTPPPSAPAARVVRVARSKR